MQVKARGIAGLLVFEAGIWAPGDAMLMAFARRIQAVAPPRE
ncbi:MAG TPA: hypothetical protein VN774_01800 [Candidatus Limnocylindrales bacterium]|nr:hypothetical protein [Candidatus Limnocylindrales bacterium]